VIAKAYPNWLFEEGFKEDDPFWVPDLRETKAARLVRARKAMDDIFSDDRNTHISISSHSGMIGSLLECESSNPISIFLQGNVGTALIFKVLGHREFGLGTGQVIPVIVKAETVVGKLPAIGQTPWEKVDLCSEPPAILLPN
jgi:hypothetical protein